MDKLYITIPTCITPTNNHHLLLQLCLRSIKQNILYNGDIYICVSLDPIQNTKNNYIQTLKYTKWLNKYMDKLGINKILFYKKHTGLAYSMKCLIDEVKTNFFFHVEHDWIFEKDINMNKYIKIMENNEEINHIKFNKRKIQKTGSDYILIQTNKYELPLVKTSSYSTNPHLARTSTYKNWWLKKFNYFLSYLFGRCEYQLFNLYKKDVYRIGFKNAHSKWGTFIAGFIGDERTVFHIGGCKYDLNYKNKQLISMDVNIEDINILNIKKTDYIGWLLQSFLERTFLILGKIYIFISQRKGPLLKNIKFRLKKIIKYIIDKS